MCAVVVNVRGFVVVFTRSPHVEWSMESHTFDVSYGVPLDGFDVVAGGLHRQRLVMPEIS